MRRTITLALVFTLLGQSSGATAPLAGPIKDGGPSPWTAVSLLFGTLQAQFYSTRLYATLIGRSNAYDAAHAPAPRFTRVAPTPLPETVFDRVRSFMDRNPRYINAIPNFSGNPRAKPDGQMHSDPLAMAQRGIPSRGVRQPHARVVRPLEVLGSSSNSGTGINRWWTYQGGAIPGAGTYVVNVANGNLVLQNDDIEVPERGIDLAFRRTYNSQSQHDYANTDASVPSSFGDGWTNTADAHMAYNPTTNVMTVYDIDGGRYDYTSDGHGNWVAPAGVYTRLAYDGSCAYDWTKKDGTMYVFLSPQLMQIPTTTCGHASTDNSYAGRIRYIYGRNHDNYLEFLYSWDGNNASVASNLNHVQVFNDDGHTLEMYFTTVNSRRLLQRIVRPDGSQVTYDYDTNGNLNCVHGLDNGSGWTTHCYSYVTGSPHLLQMAESPRWSHTNYSDGGYVSFSYSSSAPYTVSDVTGYGLMKFTPNDTTNAAVNNGVAVDTHLDTKWLHEWFVYNATSTNFKDDDLHAINWSYDTLGRVTNTQEWTGALWLNTYAQFDANNNVIATLDARSSSASDTTYRTDYAYDGNGNTIAVALPPPSAGAVRPTSLYSYDSHVTSTGIPTNNTIAYCDPATTQSIGKSWTANPGTSDSLCPQSGTTHYTWYYGDSSEPFGRKTDAYTPSGYHRLFGYNSASEGGVDAGLPTDVTGDSYTQSDGTSVTPHQSFTYDKFGNMTSYGNGIGTWTIAHDSLNRVISATDADGYTTCFWYFSNGQKQALESPGERAATGATTQCVPTSAPDGTAQTFTYDNDGNEKTDVKHTNSQPAETDKWYDGADRLVEVAAPYDSTDYANGRDFYSYRWLTRYVYDLSSGGTQQFTASGPTFAAYGGLAKTQEYVSAENEQTGTAPSTPTWTDIKAFAFDALGRTTAKYSWVAGAVQKSTVAFDSIGTEGVSDYGLTTSDCNGNNECHKFGYDAAARRIEVDYTGSQISTPNKSFTVDLNGRTTSISETSFSSVYGTIQLSPEQFSFNADGELVKHVESSGGPVTSPATITYDYYPDGLRKDLSVASSGLSQTNFLQYNYQLDGKLKKKTLAYPGGSGASLAYAYSSAGRVLTKTDAAGSNTWTTSKTYDGFGRPQGITMPGGNIGTFAYDQEGEKTSEYYSGLNTNVTFSYNIRGDLLYQSNTGVTLQRAAVSANGTLVRRASGVYAGAAGFDAYMGVNTSQITNSTYLNGYTWSFDKAGRLSDTLNQVSVDSTTESIRSYDPDNQVVLDAPGSQSQTFHAWSYMRSPGGRLFVRGTNPHDQVGVAGNIWTYDTIHWDGDEILFITNPSGAVKDVKLGLEADYTPLDSVTVTFWDRDTNGSIISCHNSAGAASVTPADSRPGPTTCSNLASTPTLPNTTTVNSTVELMSQNGDGYYDGNLTFQGVRTYDSTIGSFTTPDAFSGHVKDPASQKPYMWNHNNPLSYSDPSGYQPLFTDSSEIGFGDRGEKTDEVSFNTNDKQTSELIKVIQVAENAILEALATGGGAQQIADSMNNALKGDNFHVDAIGDTVAGHNNAGQSVKIEPLSNHSGYKTSYSIGGGPTALNYNSIIRVEMVNHDKYFVRLQNYHGHYEGGTQFFYGWRVETRSPLGTDEWLDWLHNVIDGLHDDGRVIPG